MLSPIIEDNFAEIHFINSMLSLGLKSPLYQEVREKQGLAYFINCYLSRVNNQGVAAVTTQTSNKNVDKVVDTVKKIFENPDKFLTKERFSLVKDYYLVRRQKDDILRYKSVGKWISPQGWSIDGILDKVKLSDLKDVYEKYYNFDEFYVSNDKTEFKKNEKEPA